jgi:transposase
LCQAVNALRGRLAELGIVAAKGLAKGETLIEIVCDENDRRLPPAVRTALKILADQVEALTERVDTLVRLDLPFV